MKIALITGANGQDASYLAELLIDKGYIVYGTIRRNSVCESQTSRIAELHAEGKIRLRYADLLDPYSIDNVIAETTPDEIYHLAAQSHVRISYEMPKYTMETNVNGTLAVLEAVKKYCPHSRVYNAASSEMFGNSIDSDRHQRETTPMHPVSPYGCSKLCAYSLCNNYRNAYGLFIANGILFNHESPRRGSNFVTSKIIKTAVEISQGKTDRLELGNLYAERDWGHVKDYVYAMWLMLQAETPSNYVVATGVTRSVKYLVEVTFGQLGLNWAEYVTINPDFKRAEELDYLCGDSTKIHKELGWYPRYSFYKLIGEMISHYSGLTIEQKKPLCKNSS